MDVNSALGFHGAGELVTSCGQDFHIMCPTQEHKASYEAWVKLGCRNELLAQRPYLAQHEFQRLQRMMDAQMHAGYYGWGSDVLTAVAGSEKGSNYFLMLLLQKHHPDATVDTVKAIRADNEAGLQWAYQAALYVADPSLFSPPTTERPAGVKPYRDLLSTQNGSAAPSATLPGVEKASTNP